MQDIFERALDEDPDDRATLAAYGDWLSEQGDPRGEFIQLQLSLSDPHRVVHDDPTKRRMRLLELLATHGRAWTGPYLHGHLCGRYEQLIPENLQRQGCGYAFRNGWLAQLDFDANPYLAATIAREPQCRRLTGLAIRRPPAHNYGVTEILADSSYGSYLGNIRSLEIGVRGSYASEPATADLVAVMPRVRQLELFVQELDAKMLFQLPLPQLTTLQLTLGQTESDTRLTWLAENASLQRLSKLSLIAPREGRYADGLEDLEALARSPHLRQLTELTWHYSGLGDQGISELIESGLLTRLERLDLSSAWVTDRGAEQLAAALSSASKLKSLTLDQNRLTQRGIDALTRPGLRLSTYNQRSTAR